jgi:hypothetical protein
MAWKDRHDNLLERRRPPVEGPGQTTNSGPMNALRDTPPTSTSTILTRRDKAPHVTLIVLCCLLLFVWLYSNRLDLQEGTHLSDAPIKNKVAATNSVCDGYGGILHISQGDSQGAAGTIFFLFVVNQLLYAEKFNLLPWVHLNNVSHYVYDPLVHGSGTSVAFQALHGFVPSTTAFVDPISKQQLLFPGRPIQQTNSLQRQTETVTGNGVWESYFEPVSTFTPGDCPHLPLLRLTPSQLISIHIHWPPSVRAWRYGGMPPSLIQPDLTYDQWFAPMRDRGSALLEKYVRPKQHLVEMARRVVSLRHSPQHCLAIHIRHSDKANRRKRIPVKKFLPYAQAYYEEVVMRTNNNNSNSNNTFSDNAVIFLATDSHKVIHDIQRDWPSDLVDRMTWQTGATIVRSNDTTPVFKMSSHHETNTQVLVDILALSKCEFMLHGLSAVSEAAMYLNRGLQYRNHSVNLETAKHSTVEDFRRTIQKWKSNKEKP